MTSVRSQMRLKQHREEFEAQQREEAERKLRPLREAEQSFKETADTLAQRERELAAMEASFEQPSEALKSRCTVYRPDPNDSSTPEQVTVAIGNAFDGFRLDLANKGIELQPSGIEKVNRVARVNRSVLDLRSTKTWLGIFEYADELGLFNRTDVIRQEKHIEPTPEPEPQRPFNEVIETTPTNDANREMLHKLVEQAAFEQVYWGIFNEWLDSIEKHWRVRLNEKQQLAAVKWMQQHNKSFTYGKHYDECRVALSDAKVFPDLYTDDDLLCKRIEHSRLTDSYSARQEFRNESHRIHQY